MDGATESPKLADILKSKKLCIGGPLAHETVNYDGFRMATLERPPFDPFRQTDLMGIKNTQIMYKLIQWKCGHMLFEFYALEAMTDEEIMIELVCHYIGKK